MSESVAGQATEAAGAEAPAAAPVEAVAAAPATPAQEAPLLAIDPAAPDPDAKPVDAKPDAYVINLPEGTAVDQPRLDAYQGALKEAALTQEQADKLTPFLLAQFQDIQAQQLAQWADTTKQWREAVVSDPDIGGTNLRASLMDAALARDTYGTPEFKQLLADPHLGIGNHPAVVKFLAAVGKAAGEDKRGMERQVTKPAASTSDKSAEAIGSRVYANTWT